MEPIPDVFEFAASAGALEGYVYPRDRLDFDALSDWVNNLTAQYHAMDPAVRSAFQASLDRTLGRAVHSLAPVLGKDHDLLAKLQTLIQGEMPDSPHDFEQEKQTKSRKYGTGRLVS
jgi:hypothetical protein